MGSPAASWTPPRGSARARLLGVQAHGSNVREEVDGDGVLRKLESGLLLLMRLPGS